MFTMYFFVERIENIAGFCCFLIPLLYLAYTSTVCDQDLYDVT